MVRYDWKRKVTLFISGLALSGFGVAISTKAGLGTSPISSLPYVVTFLVPLSLGMTTFLMNTLFVFVQHWLLKERFPLIHYLQIPMTFLFAVFIDLGMFFCNWFIPNHYIYQMLMLFIGCLILAAGIAMQILSEVMYLPGEGIVKAIAWKFNREFSKVKIPFDLCLSASALLVSLLAFASVKGLREGTLIAALSIGVFVGFFLRHLRFLKKLCLVRL